MDIKNELKGDIELEEPWAGKTEPKRTRKTIPRSPGLNPKRIRSRKRVRGSASSQRT
jgi:hypothetical protein